MSTTEQHGPLAPPDLLVKLEDSAQQIEKLATLMQGALEPAEEADSTAEAPSPEQVRELIVDMRQKLELADAQLRRLEEAHGCAPQRKPARPKVQIPPQGIRGSTQFISIPELLNLLTAQSKTGTLHIKHDDERFVLEFVEGSIVHAASNSPLPEQRLGEILVAHGAIDKESLDTFLAEYDPKNGPIGSALARAELISSEGLHDALDEQVRGLFRRIFALENALFYFADGNIRDLEFRVRLNTTRLLLESARFQDEDGRDA